MDPVTLATERQRAITARADTAVRRALVLWDRADFNSLDLSWLSIGPQVTALTSTVQYVNAREATRYANKVALDDPVQVASRVVPELFIGADGSGRDLETLLHGAVTTTKESTRRGLARREAMLAGASYLAAMMTTAIADLARASDVAAAGGKGWTTYIRVISPGACSRCALLAGKSSYSTPFPRHPACKCTALRLPSVQSPVPDGLFASPAEYFESLSAAEQDRVFTKAGAEAIRQGADVSRVVSARRGNSGIGAATSGVPRGRLQRTIIGYRTDGTPIQVYVTGEGTTVRGGFGATNVRLGERATRDGADRYRRSHRYRLMPETIMEVADGDPAVARVLLRDAGYIETDWRLPLEQREAQQRADRAWADRIYRSAGYTL